MGIVVVFASNLGRFDRREATAMLRVVRRINRLSAGCLSRIGPGSREQMGCREMKEMTFSRTHVVLGTQVGWRCRLSSFSVFSFQFSVFSKTHGHRGI
jgi:hypothetical protein